MREPDLKKFTKIRRYPLGTRFRTSDGRICRYGKKIAPGTFVFEDKNKILKVLNSIWIWWRQVK